MRNLWILWLLLFMSAGCANTDASARDEVRILSVREDAAYEQKLDRVLIVLSLDNSFLDGGAVARSFVNNLNKRGITIRILMQKQDLLQLDRGKDLKLQIWSFRPTQVMEIALTEAHGSSYNGPLYMYWNRIKGTLYDTRLKKQVWSFDHNATQRVEADKFVNAVVQKMNADGLLPLPLTPQSSASVEESAAPQR